MKLTIIIPLLYNRDNIFDSINNSFYVMNIKDIDIAVVHANWGIGGGEHVSEHLTRALDADLYYMYSVEGGSPPDSLETTQLFRQSILSRSILYRDLKYMLTTTKIEDLFDYDVIVQSGNEAGWYVPKDNQNVIRYLHSTPRNPYDQHWRADSRVNKLYSFVARVLYPHTVPFVDKFITNSELVSRRARKYWGILDEDLRVIYPPVNIRKYSPTQSSRDSYLFISRLVNNKRVDKTLDAITQTSEELIVAGDGPLSTTVENYEDKHECITYEGYVTEEKKIQLLQECKAVIYPPHDEDFGIVPIESFAAGTPVITVPEGFPQFVVKNGYNGYISDGVTDKHIKDAILEFESNGVEASPTELHEIAEQFDATKFEQDIRDEVLKTVESTKLDVDIV
jgi:glycosyltransferase involved in cell wall biosynthesis